MWPSRLLRIAPQVSRYAIRPWRCVSLLSRQRLSSQMHSATRKRPSIHRDRAVRKKALQFGLRSLFTESIPPFLLPPAIFIGLLLGLWTWKCVWIIIMQNKLLYLSWLPPFSRSDKISEYESECRPVQWEEHRIRSLDGTRLTVCQGHIPATGNYERHAPARKEESVVICYFQGNGGSTPLRLPLLSQVLRALPADATPNRTNYTVLALSYRGYWTSSGRATQSGIEADAQAFLMWVSRTFSPCQIVLWGHSLGSAVAASVLLENMASPKGRLCSGDEPVAPIQGLIMEAPISNIKDMLISLYPQKWLPYRYLWPFSWNSWCNYTNLERLASLRSQNDYNRGTSQSKERNIPPILILSAQKDEVIPPNVADQLEHKGMSLGLDIQRQDILGAMHTEIPVKAEGRNALVDFICKTTQ